MVSPCQEMEVFVRKRRFLGALMPIHIIMFDLQSLINPTYMDTIYMDAIYMDTIYMDTIYMDTLQANAVPQCTQSYTAVWAMWADYEKFCHGYVSF